MSKSRIASQPNLPTLLSSVAHYNIVEYDGRVFGVLQGEPITWGAPGYDQDARLMIGKTERAVKSRINSLPKPPMLLSVDGHYNIVSYDGRMFGVPQGMAIEWGAPGYDTDKRFVIAETEREVRRAIANQPILVAVDGPYNIVRYNGRVFGVLHSLPITWGAPGYDRDQRLIIAANVPAVQQRIRETASSSP